MRLFLLSIIISLLQCSSLLVPSTSQGIQSFILFQVDHPVVMPSSVSALLQGCPRLSPHFVITPVSAPGATPLIPPLADFVNIDPFKMSTKSATLAPPKLQSCDSTSEREVASGCCGGNTTITSGCGTGCATTTSGCGTTPPTSSCCGTGSEPPPAKKPCCGANN
jgi:hypothetical protein